MKKFLKFLKVFVIVIVIIVALVYGTVFVGHNLLFPIEKSATPTIEPIENNKYHLGVQFQEHDTDMSAFIKDTLAIQIKNYQKRAAGLWPDNHVTDKYVIAECIESGKFWLITPEGEVNELSKDEVLSYNVPRSPYSDAFNSFSGNGISGMYLAVSEKDLNNYLVFQKYVHLGTYDVFITYVHELFHMDEQPNWAEPTDIANRERDEYAGNTDARAKRYLLQDQLAAAMSDPANREKLILDAIATYKDYKDKFSEDYNGSKFFDRIEGTAYYIELIASLYSAYPDQIKNTEDLHEALGLLVTNDRYRAIGAIIEGYHIGAFAGILLDETANDDGTIWKEELMKNPDLTPMDILEQQYADVSLPEPKDVPEKITAKIEDNYAESERGGGPSALFRMLYQLMF
jgi:hypothetical protein